MLDDDTGVELPRSESGDRLQAIYAGGTLGGSPLALSAGVAAGPAEEVGSTAFYLFCSSIVHVSLSGPATVASFPVDASGGAVITCSPRESVSLLLASGEPDSSAWVCPVR